MALRGMRGARARGPRKQGRRARRLWADDFCGQVTLAGPRPQNTAGNPQSSVRQERFNRKAPLSVVIVVEIKTAEASKVLCDIRLVLLRQ